MGLVKEFKEFAIKGNMIDMAVGIIIGTAFNRVVDALVKQIIMPPISIMTNGTRFINKKFVLREAIFDNAGVPVVEEVAVGYGAFVGVLIDFFIIGFTVFLVIKFMNRFRRKAEDPKISNVEPAKDIQLLTRLNKLIEEQNELLKKNRKGL